MPEPSRVGRSLRAIAGLLAAAVTSRLFRSFTSTLLCGFLLLMPGDLHRVVLSVAICARRIVYSNFQLRAYHMVTLRRVTSKCRPRCLPPQTTSVNSATHQARMLSDFAHAFQSFQLL